MSNCKGCGASIIWIKTKKGKNMPIDAKPVKAYIKSEDAQVDLYTMVDVHLTHWGTCPKSRAFKKKKG